MTEESDQWLIGKIFESLKNEHKRLSEVKKVDRNLYACLIVNQQKYFCTFNGRQNSISITHCSIYLFRILEYNDRCKESQKHTQI